MGKPAKMTRRRIGGPFSPVFGASHSMIKRSHSTSCELLTSGMPSCGLLAFRHLFVPKSAPKPVHCLTAFELAPFVFKRLERVGDWCSVNIFRNAENLSTFTGVSAEIPSIVAHLKNGSQLG